MADPASDPRPTPPTRPSLLPLSIVYDLFDEGWDDEETTKVEPLLKETPHGR